VGKCVQRESAFVAHGGNAVTVFSKAVNRRFQQPGGRSQGEVQICHVSIGCGTYHRVLPLTKLSPNFRLDCN
jgi:hypothetical protein